MPTGTADGGGSSYSSYETNHSPPRKKRVVINAGTLRKSKKQASAVERGQRAPGQPERGTHANLNCETQVEANAKRKSENNRSDLEFIEAEGREALQAQDTNHPTEWTYDTYVPDRTNAFHASLRRAWMWRDASQPPVQVSVDESDGADADADAEGESAVYDWSEFGRHDIPETEGGSEDGECEPDDEYILRAADSESEV